MELHMWDDFPSHLGETEILDNQGIDSGGSDEAELGFGGFELSGEDEGIHGDESFDSVLVEVGHQIREILFGEIVSAESGVEFRQTKVNGIGTGGDGSASAVPVSSG